MSIGALRREPGGHPLPPEPHDPKPHDDAPPAEAPAGESPFAKVLVGLGHAAAHGEHAVGHAVTASGQGRDLSAAELLSLQASVYRYSEVIDLASKLVDRATTGVKTVIQGQ